MKELRLNAPSGSTTIRVGEHLSRGLGILDPPPVILIDENVLREHRELFGQHPCLIIPSGERYKTVQTLERVYRELVQREADRSSLLVGVGGGVTTDIAGYVGSTYMRGVEFGFIATSLLGQVDASIGGKNGVNLDGYKNMVGTIRQPGFVWCDLSLLETLERREYISGIAEVIKYGAILDGSFLHYLEEHMEELLSLDGTVLTEVVSRSAGVKAEIVEKDEKESGMRRLLNFGHTLGHAIERERKVLHGEAVSAGMVMAARLSVNLGMLRPEGADQIERLVTAAGLPSEMPLDARAIYENIRKDKKKSGESIYFVLLREPGVAVVKQIPLDELKTMLHDLC